MVDRCGAESPLRSLNVYMCSIVFLKKGLFAVYFDKTRQPTLGWRHESSARRKAFTKRAPPHTVTSQPIPPHTPITPIPLISFPRRGPYRSLVSPRCRWDDPVSIASCPLSTTPKPTTRRTQQSYTSSRRGQGGGGGGKTNKDEVALLLSQRSNLPIYRGRYSRGEGLVPRKHRNEGSAEPHPF